jgi:hypothetical protein
MTPGFIRKGRPCQSQSMWGAGGSPVHFLFMKKSLFFCGALAISLLAGCGSVDIVSEIDSTGPTSVSTGASLLSVLYASPDCERFEETVHNEFIHTYGKMGCKLPLLSPDGTYIAYVTLSRQQDEQRVYFTDVVKVFSAQENTSVTEVHLALRKNHVSRLQWGPTGQLMIWETIWEGDWALLIYDVSAGELLARMRTDQPDLQWNPQQTAFYTVHAGDYGKSTCISELGGFDFETNTSFPDFYDLLDVERSKTDLAGIPYSVDDDIRIEPFAWSRDGSKLWLTTKVLDWLGDEIYQYEIKPGQAGFLEFSEIGITYTVLSSDSEHDYFFQTPSDPEIVSKPYIPQTCP